MEVKVNHSIGDIVKQKHTGIEYMVIGYEYVDGQSPRYICIEPKDGMQKYIYGCELEKGKDNFIGFNIIEGN